MSEEIPAPPAAVGDAAEIPVPVAPVTPADPAPVAEVPTVADPTPTAEVTTPTAEVTTPGAAKPAASRPRKKAFPKWVPTCNRTNKSEFTSYSMVVDVEKGVAKVVGVDAEGEYTALIKADITLGNVEVPE